MQLHGSKLHFRGARGDAGIKRLAKAAGLFYDENVVFMCVCSMHLGKRIQTKKTAFFEQAIYPKLPGVQLVKRLFDENLHIRLSFRGKNWLPPLQRRVEFGFPAGQAPTSLHIRIAFHGHVQMRVGFKDVLWSETLETSTLQLCSYLQQRIIECC